MPHPVKRKAKTGVVLSRKKVKTKHLDDLPWKTVNTPKETGFGEDLDGILELEEVDDVEVVYEETGGGRVVRFNVVDNAESEGAVSDHEGEVEAVSHAGPSSRAQSEERESLEESSRFNIDFDSRNLLPDWHPFSLQPQLLRTLYSQRFFSPTPIQSRALPVAFRGKDVIGVAETGSGKTLAYGLPILHYLLDQASFKAPGELKEKRRACALILAPTRELALQVSSHLNACLNIVDIVIPEVKQEDSAGNKSKGPPLVSVAAIVGGMSAQKQRRILDRGVDVLVATPGRLWDIIQEDDELAEQLKDLRFLVLDEADRMIESGHFAELDNILRLTLRSAQEDEIEPEFNGFSDGEAKESVNGEDDGHNDENDSKNGKDQDVEEIEQLQTFVFSATLSKDLQRNLKKRSRPHFKGKKNSKPASTLDDLLMRLDFRDPEPEIIDLSPEGGVVSTLKESKIDCLSTNKDAYLYYFLLRYPGRTLVFLSSIDGIRRLIPLMELLEVKAFPLHSQLEQRQRLKNLDRFKTTPNSVLLSTDIASRGLDIPSVDHVIHYQIPHSADVYVHRNGRTARAMRSGFSLLMCAPDERRILRGVMGSLGRQEEDIPEISVELYLLDKLKARIQLAKRIDSAQHKVKKENHEKNWLREAAEAMEIEVDSDFGLSDDDETDVPSKHKKKTLNAKTASLKAELKQLLAQPLIARGVSTRYITSGTRSIADDVLAGEYHDTMLGLKKTQAGNDVVAVKGKKVKKVKEEIEEWHGFGSS